MRGFFVSVQGVAQGEKGCHRTFATKIVPLLSDAPDVPEKGQPVVDRSGAPPLARPELGEAVHMLVYQLP